MSWPVILSGVWRCWRWDSTCSCQRLTVHRPFVPSPMWPRSSRHGPMNSLTPAGDGANCCCIVAWLPEFMELNGVEAARAHPGRNLFGTVRRGASAGRAARSDVRGQRRGLGFTPRCQCGPCDLDGLCDNLCDLDARLFGVVPPLKHERKNRLRTLVEDVEAIARVGHLHDIAHRAVPEAEARQCLSPGATGGPPLIPVLVEADSRGGIPESAEF